MSDTDRLRYVQIGNDCVHDGDVGEETFQRVTLSYRLPLLFWLHVDCNIGMIVCHWVPEKYEMKPRGNSPDFCQSVC